MKLTSWNNKVVVLLLITFGVVSCNNGASGTANQNFAHRSQPVPAPAPSPVYTPTQGGSTSPTTQGQGHADSRQFSHHPHPQPASIQVQHASGSSPPDWALPFHSNIVRYESPHPAQWTSSDHHHTHSYSKDWEEYRGHKGRGLGSSKDKAPGGDMTDEFTDAVLKIMEIFGLGLLLIKSISVGTGMPFLAPILIPPYMIFCAILLFLPTKDVSFPNKFVTLSKSYA